MELEFKNDKEELEYHRDYCRRVNDIINEIHDLLGIDKDYPNRLHIVQIGKKELIQLKNAIKNKLKQNKKQEDKDESNN